MWYLRGAVGQHTEVLKTYYVAIDGEEDDNAHSEMNEFQWKWAPSDTDYLAGK
jgi:hypothetical protein